MTSAAPGKEQKSETAVSQTQKSLCPVIYRQSYSNSQKIW